MIPSPETFTTTILAFAVGTAVSLVLYRLLVTLPSRLGERMDGER